MKINSDSEIQDNKKGECNCHFSYWSLGEIAIVIILLLFVARYAYKRYGEYKQKKKSMKLLQLQALFKGSVTGTVHKDVHLVPSAPSVSLPLSSGPYSDVQAELKDEQEDKPWLNKLSEIGINLNQEHFDK